MRGGAGYRKDEEGVLMERRRFTDESKGNAVAYCLEHKGEVSLEHAAANLGVSLSAFGRWVRGPRYGGGDGRAAAPAPGPATSMLRTGGLRRSSWGRLPGAARSTGRGGSVPPCRRRAYPSRAAGAQGPCAA
ncbi:MAG: transposase [Coriobacteriia bacterium]|nr:transposase [Coriobacteriia bacterium]